MITQNKRDHCSSVHSLFSPSGVSDIDLSRVKTKHGDGAKHTATFLFSEAPKGALYKGDQRTRAAFIGKYMQRVAN